MEKAMKEKDEAKAKNTPNEPRKIHEKEEKQEGATVYNFNTKKKVGRNDPCPCGSGKKYKRCCL